MNEALIDLFKRFEIIPKNIDLYKTAFTHISYTNQNKLEYSYERLEFLGDAVIDDIVAEFLYKTYPEYSVGELSKIHSLITKGETMSIAGNELKFRDILRFGSTFKSKEEITDRVLEDLFEAFCGAVFLDQGREKVELITKNTIIHYYLKHNVIKDDYKSIVNELNLHAKYINNFDSNKNMYFSTLFINNKSVSVGSGSKIKDAQNEAARKFYLSYKK